MGSKASKPDSPEKPLKTYGVDLHQDTQVDITQHFDEEKFNRIFTDTEEMIFDYSKQNKDVFNISGKMIHAARANSRITYLLSRKAEFEDRQQQILKEKQEQLSAEPDHPVAEILTELIAKILDDKLSTLKAELDAVDYELNYLNANKGKMEWKNTRDITYEIKSIPAIIKERAKTIIEYFLLNRLATKNVFERKIQDGMYKVISFAIIEYFLTMYEWDNIFRQIHQPLEINYDPYILQDVKRFIKGMIAGFKIVPSNPEVSKEISDMMNLVVGEIARSSTFYGGKMSKRSKRMKRRTVKCKRRTKMHKKKC